MEIEKDSYENEIWKAKMRMRSIKTIMRMILKKTLMRMRFGLRYK